MVKTVFTECETELITFDGQDVITTSGTGAFDGEEDLIILP